MQNRSEPVVHRLFPGDLEISQNELIRLMGYPQDRLPDPYPEMLEEEMNQIEHYDDIAGGYILFENAYLQNKSSLLQIGDVHFGIGRMIGGFMKGTSSAALFICTAGKKITDRISELASEQKFLEAYICDLIGTLIVESAMESITLKMKSLLETRGLKLTNRYSPGYCEWDVSDQHKLFSFFPTGFCGVRLTPSALMFPIKSVSGVIGIGQNAVYNPYHCEYCSQKNCLNRKVAHIEE